MAFEELQWGGKECKNLTVKFQEMDKWNRKEWVVGMVYELVTVRRRKGKKNRKNGKF